MSIETIEQATLTVDLVLLAYDSQMLRIAHILLINGKFGWSLPGGKVRQGERIIDGLKRESVEEVGVLLYQPEMIGVFDIPDRDPRGRYISFAFRDIVPYKDSVKPVAGSDAKEVRWFPLGALPQLAFDHLDIIEKAVDTLPNGLTSIEVRRAQR